ncbi:MAG: di-trans,poly-cis-decaprenylcistransferase [Candidatus Melainabacteria bacterium RIFOXYA12_FULL_32_12]|nr:MAG: di-trans,poly-cis-decaprenylcistransferase [Candidatus Melainabacteria bacterium RIFOXYA2_FULL_32_9]OGI24796.1 MAG: di-trans,poly-cis-decaprenylcistransferase [Candidatus Melainabacteria bacterium RIFOXYA12_FULL_32_12]
MAVNNKLSLAPVQEIVLNTKLQHIAIIMDGNRRWAKKHLLPSMSGHNAGVKSLKTIVSHAAEIGVKYLTVYAFSTENWGRKKEEVDFLMMLLGETVKKELDELHKNNVKIRIIGNMENLNPELQKILEYSMNVTAANTGLNLQVAINYGSRDEITQAMKKIVKDVQAEKLSPDDINSDLISNYLYTSDIPDPDLLIRTGGDQRLSNYLLWQLAYTEIYVSDTLWPDFGKDELDEAVAEFAKRERRFGKG